MVTLGTAATVPSTTSISATFNGVTSPPVILTVTLAGSSSTNGLLTPRYDHTATLLHDGTVLVAGGYNTVALASAELYTPGSTTSTGTWTAAANMAVGRRDHTATLLSTGHVLLIGGGTASGDLTSGEMYTPVSGVTPASWTAYPGMLTQTRSYHTATLLNNSANLTANGKELVLVVGGGLASTADLVDPSSPPGTRATSVPDIWPRYSHTATLLNDGTVLVTGGFDTASASVLAQAELFAPTGASVVATSPLTTPRYLHSATLLANGPASTNGKVLVVGGIDAMGNILAGAELYDPVAGTWSPTGSLAVPRFGHIATLMTSGPNIGKVLVMGGRNASNPTLSSAELYDPGTGTWSATANLQKGRAVFSATLLSTGPDAGSVLVVGGEGTVNGNYVVLPDVELHN
ncbi:kelch motif protein [mine drainage metagenome]|uniref:Kelch motif protein n=1 Tax=mine drainage metagenome TaxID=410659 RepID=A0A1J5SZJ3_9ZZZZ